MNNFLAVTNSGLTMGFIFVPAVFAMMIALRIVDFPDLSIEGTFPLGASVAGLCLKNGYPVSFSMFMAVLAGSLSGIVTGTIHERLKVSKLLCGIIVLTMLYSINLRIMGGSNLSLLGVETLFSIWEEIDYKLETTLGWSIFNVAKNSFLLVQCGAVGLISLFLLRSRLGLRLQTVGSNRIFADRVGIRSSYYLMGALATTNLLSAFSGSLLAMHQGFADVGMGQGVLVVTLASLAVGEKTTGLLKWKNRIPFLVFSAFVGSVLYQTLIAVAIRAGLAASDLKIATAILVLAAVAFHFYRKQDVMVQHGY